MTNLAIVCALPVSPVLDNKHETKDDLQTADSHDNETADDLPDDHDPDLPDAVDKTDADASDAKDDFVICQPCAVSADEMHLVRPETNNPSLCRM